MDASPRRVLGAELRSPRFGETLGAGAVAAALAFVLVLRPADVRPPERLVLMASTRSLLRILDVPVTPSSAASAWSSGSRSAEIAALRLDPPVLVLTADSMVSVTKDPSPSSGTAAHGRGARSASGPISGPARR